MVWAHLQTKGNNLLFSVVNSPSKTVNVAVFGTFWLRAGLGPDTWGAHKRELSRLRRLVFCPVPESVRFCDERGDMDMLAPFKTACFGWPQANETRQVSQRRLAILGRLRARLSGHADRV